MRRIGSAAEERATAGVSLPDRVGGRDGVVEQRISRAR
jgi:hypothetical protein